MKLLDITRKDLLQSARGLSALMFMFVVPIMITVLFWFMFGGAGEEQASSMPRTKVVIVNGDQGRIPTTPSTGTSQPGMAPSANQGQGLGSAESMGDLLVGHLQSDALADLLEPSLADTPEAARAAVDRQVAAVAIIIPGNFTDVLTGQGGAAEVELYSDPTLTLGPMVVTSILRQTLDSFVASSLGTGVVLEQASRAGVPVTPELVREVAAKHAQSASGRGDATALLAIQAPPGANSGASFVSELLAVILGGMMTFFAFFTGASAVESLLVEEENGTLQRLFTTPIPRPAILAGKGLAAIVTLVVQITVLMTFGVLVFNIDWGQPASLGLAAIGLIVLAVATGLFVVSFLQSTRQAGVIFGGVLTLTGMLGMISVFGGGVTAAPLMSTMSLLVPQGWAIRALSIAREGGTIADLAPTLLVILLWTVVLASIGTWRLQRRYA